MFSIVSIEGFQNGALQLSAIQTIVLIGFVVVSVFLLNKLTPSLPGGIAGYRF
jgi:hypothetical protein